MKIKDGFNGKETSIRVHASESGSIELWINQTGIEDRDVLSYLTPNELSELYKEVKRAGKDLFE